MPTLEAGRELDALIAEKVMGFVFQDLPDHWECDCHCGYCGRHYEGHPEPYCEFSTSIAAAFQVVEKLMQHGQWETESGASGHWHVTFRDFELGDGVADAATFPLAICRAALQALDSQSASEPRPIAG